MPAGSCLPLSPQDLAPTECSVKLLKGQMALRKGTLRDVLSVPASRDICPRALGIRNREIFGFSKQAKLFRALVS